MTINTDNKTTDYVIVITNRGERMFPEYRTLISKLKQEDAHFSKIFDEHNDLDHEIIRLEQNPITSGSDEIEKLKRQKLKLKDELYTMLKKADI